VSSDLIVFVAAIALFAIVGIALGMLVAPRLGRLAERMDEDEDERDGNN
jgi:hypothetical protein